QLYVEALLLPVLLRQREVVYRRGRYGCVEPAGNERRLSIPARGTDDRQRREALGDGVAERGGELHVARAPGQGAGNARKLPDHAARHRGPLRWFLAVPATVPRAKESLRLIAWGAASFQ